jgi:hypothetical protein
MKISHGLVFAGILSMIATFSGCSGDNETEEPVAEGEEGEATDEAAAPAAEEAPAEPAAEPEAAPAPEPAPAVPAGPVGFDGAKVTRYVTTYALNVRTAPDKAAPVKRWVKKGDRVEVVINGEWAKLGDNEYISSNRLSEKNPGPSKAGAAAKAKAKPAPKKGKK